MSCAVIEHAFRHVMRLGDYRVRAWWEPYTLSYRAELQYRHPYSGNVFAYREQLPSELVEAHTATGHMECRQYLRYLARRMYMQIHEFRLNEMEKLDDR